MGEYRVAGTRCAEFPSAEAYATTLALMTGLPAPFILEKVLVRRNNSWSFVTQQAYVITGKLHQDDRVRLLDAANALSDQQRVQRAASKLQTPHNSLT